MKKVFILLFVFCSLYNSKLQAQNDNEISLDDLEIPSSPAFILLDVAPTSIETPTTTKSFSTSILNSINENNGIPENYAVDFAPYWFFKHEKLTAKKYWGYKKVTGPKIDYKRMWWSQLRYGNVSFATVKSEKIVDTVGTSFDFNNIAIGLRTTLVQLRKKGDIRKLDELNNRHKKITSGVIDATSTPEELIARLESIDELTEINSKINEVLNRKPIISLDFAFASSWSFESNNYNSIQSNRLGGWLTFNYSQSLNQEKSNEKNDYLNLYLTGRILNDNNVLNDNGELKTSTFFDSGGKLEFELNKLSFSYEYLYRKDLLGILSDTYHSSCLIRYRASDNLLVSAAFGKNFGSQNNVITQISLNWGISSKSQNIVSENTQ